MLVNGVEYKEHHTALCSIKQIGVYEMKNKV